MKEQNGERTIKKNIKTKKKKNIYQKAQMLSVVNSKIFQKPTNLYERLCFL